MGCGSSARPSSMDADAPCTCKAEPGVEVNSAKVAVGKVVESGSPSTAASEPLSPSPSVPQEPPRLFGPTPQGTPGFLVQGVLACLPWHERGARVLCLSPAFLAACPQEPQSSYWRFLCERLAVEAHLFLPRDVARLAEGGSWREIFFALWALRHAMAPADLFRGEPE